MRGECLWFAFVTYVCVIDGDLCIGGIFRPERVWVDVRHQLITLMTVVTNDSQNHNDSNNSSCPGNLNITNDLNIT